MSTQVDLASQIAQPNPGVADTPIPTSPPESFGARLASLPPERVLTTDDLQWIFAVNTNGITRMLKRGELPPPANLKGGHVWTVRAILAHIDTLQEQARKDATREKQQRDAKVKSLYGRD